MAKSSRIGQRNTRIIIKRLMVGVDVDGFPTERWEAIFESPVWCMWVSAFGASFVENARAGEMGNATINMPYTPWVDNRCRIWRADEPEDEQHAFEIIGEPNNLDRRELEIKVRRRVVA